jgi:hypothetical protein
MVISHRWIRSALVIALFGSSASAQQRPNDVDQRSIELAAARAVTSLGRSFANWALDPRLYINRETIFGPDGSLSSGPPVPPAAELASSHNWEHLAAIARVLGVESILDDAQTCVVVAMQLCRVGTFKGIVASTGRSRTRNGTAALADGPTRRAQVYD